MNTTPYRRIVAIVGAAAITSITVGTGATAASADDQQDSTSDRPCFMVRAQWNDAEGPQPTCPVPTWQIADDEVASPAADTRSTARTTPAVAPAASARIGDFMP
jgi:hypothetical protein